MNLFTKQEQTYRNRKQPYGYQRGEQGGEVGRDKLRGWDMHAAIYKIDKQKGSTVQHRELYSVFYNSQ